MPSCSAPSRSNPRPIGRCSPSPTASRSACGRRNDVEPKATLPGGTEIGFPVETTPPSPHPRRLGQARPQDPAGADQDGFRLHLHRRRPGWPPAARLRPDRADYNRSIERSGVHRRCSTPSSSLLLEQPDLPLEPHVVRLQLPDARLRRREIVDTDLLTGAACRPCAPTRPALDDLAPAQLMLLDERVGGLARPRPARRRARSSAARGCGRAWRCPSG